MQLADVNPLIYAHIASSQLHDRYRDWLTDLLNGEAAFAVCDFVINGFIRIVTNPKVIDNPTSLDDALAFAERIRHHPQAVVVAPGSRHWSIFTRLCRETRAKAKDVPDAYLAALAIEHGCEFVTEDKGFGRYQDLRLRTVPPATE